MADISAPELSEILTTLAKNDAFRFIYASPEPLPAQRPTSVMPMPRIVVTISGKRDYTYSDGSKIVHRECGAGDIIVLSQYSWFDVHSVPEVGHKTLSVVFREDCLRFVVISGDYRTKHIRYLHTVNPPGPAAYHCMLSLVALHSANCAGEADKLARVLFSLCSKEISLAANVIEGEPESSPFLLRRIKCHIDENLHMPIDRKSIAKEFAINPNYVSQLFGKNGEQLNRYICHKRMEKAAFLLTMTNLTVNEISHKCGFSQPNYFIKVFKSQFNQTPIAYRNSCLG